MKQSAYFAPLVTLPIVITESGWYLTRRGERVAINAVSARNDFCNIGRYSSGEIEGWHRSGRLYSGTLSANDIVARAS